MEALIENFLGYAFGLVLIILILYFYLKSNAKQSKDISKKIDKAKEQGFYEPNSLHPVIDSDICIGSGACVAACPEHDILGLVNGRGRTINASRCVGHGACFHACPVQAISLCIGTEKRGVELHWMNRIPHFVLNTDEEIGRRPATAAIEITADFSEYDRHT